MISPSGVRSRAFARRRRRASAGHPQLPGGAGQIPRRRRHRRLFSVIRSRRRSTPRPRRRCWAWPPGRHLHRQRPFVPGGRVRAAQRRIAEQELQSLNLELSAVAEEVAERLKAEEALRQAQKMEAVGQLTGGGRARFQQSADLDHRRPRRARCRPVGPTRRSCAAALDMAMQGAAAGGVSLTQPAAGLLAAPAPRAAAGGPGGAGRRQTELLHRTVGETIELEGVPRRRSGASMADPNQLESALLNLAVNARDAMPNGGKLTIENRQQHAR